MINIPLINVSYVIKTQNTLKEYSRLTTSYLKLLKQITFTMLVYEADR